MERRFAFEIIEKRITPATFYELRSLGRRSRRRREQNRVMRPPRFATIRAIRGRSRQGPTRSTGPANRSASRGAWLMLGGAFAAFTVSAGIMHSYAVFLLAFIEEFRWSRAETSIAYSVSQLVAGGSSPLVGALVDRLGPRRLLVLGGVLLFGGLVGSALISALWQDVLFYGIVMTIGANCLGLVVFVPMLSRQFVRRRGMAISIVQSANGFGRAASAPLVQYLISTIGWRETFWAQAAFIAAAVPLLAALFRRAARYPLTSQSAPMTPASPEAPLPAVSWTLSDAIRTPHFWLLFAVYLFTGLGSFSGLAAPARLCRQYRFRQALRRRSARHRRVPRGSRQRSSPARYRTISVASCRRSWPTASRSSGSSARCSSPAPTSTGCCGCTPVCSD